MENQQVTNKDSKKGINMAKDSKLKGTEKGNGSKKSIKSKNKKDTKNDSLESDLDLSNKIDKDYNNQEEKKDDNYKEKYLYLAAEMENLKRRAAKDKEELLLYGNEKLLSSLLDVLDNFDRTLEMISNDKDSNDKIKSICQGISMVQKSFLDKLSKSGLKVIKSLGEIFDPNFHEAVSQQEVVGKKEGEIIGELQRGYLLNGRLLRASKVIVAQNKQ